jgi:hypothetical protein
MGLNKGTPGGRLGGALAATETKFTVMTTQDATISKSVFTWQSFQGRYTEVRVQHDYKVQPGEPEHYFSNHQV